MTAPSKIGIVSRIDCESGEEFFRYLRFGGSIWRNATYGDMAFRGQGNADWSLLPKAFRNGTVFGYRNRQMAGPFARIADQCNAEATSLLEFLELADTVGLAVPDGAGVIQSLNVLRTATQNSIGEGTWPDPGLWELLAVAQHHGIPTRLLDFSLHPFVAAFFAAEDAREAEHPSRFAVWAIDLRFVRRSVELSPGRERVRVVQVPRGGNSYLHAQHGLFLIDKTINETWAASVPPLDVVIEQSAADALGRHGFWRSPYSQNEILPAVTSITCPQDQALDVLKRLNAEGVTQAHLMPDLSGVFKALELIRTLP
jgi:hypothetical protein